MRSYPSVIATSIGLDADIWYRCRVQRSTVQDEDEPAEAQTIQAVPAIVRGKKHGWCNCVLVKDDDDVPPTGMEGIHILESLFNLTLIYDL